jgi:Tol biopolymer transport system component
MSAAWAPDGRSVALLRATGTEDDVVVRSVESGEERVYRRSGLNNASPRWFPDSRSLLVTAGDSAADEPVFHAIDTATGAFTRLFPVDHPDHERTGVGSLAPDGTTLYLIARDKTAGAQWDRIVAVNIPSGRETHTIALPAGSLPGNTLPSIVVSPDGNTLAVQGWTDATMKTGRLFTIGVDGTGFREVHAGFSTDRTFNNVRWTPDGQSLLFATLGDGGQLDRQVRRVPVTGGEPTVELDLSDRSALGTARISLLWSLDVSPIGSSLLIGALALEKTELWSVSNVVSLLNAK